MNRDHDLLSVRTGQALAADLKLAQSTALTLFERLQPDLGGAFEIVKGDPRWFDKHTPGFVRLRLQPVNPQPKNFWNRDWCMYAIKVGPWAEIGAQLGAVMFGMYPNQAICGGGRYTQAVREILAHLPPRDPAEFFCDLAAGGKRNAFYCGFSYKFRHKTFPVERAVEDLAWLIRNTYPQFAGLAGPPPRMWVPADLPPSRLAVARQTATDAKPVPATGLAVKPPVQGETLKALAVTARRLSETYRQRLDELKAEQAQLQRSDFLWHFLLQSFATMGRAAGWTGLIGTPSNYERLRFETLQRLSPSARARQVERTCRDAKIRMPSLKAGYILGCYDRIVALGGPAAAKAELLRQPGREGKIHWLKEFPGIGDKYARNIMMDVYHEDFRDSIAIDARIKGLSDALGLSFPDYAAHEAFYLAVAAEAGLNGWELDRLIFHHQAEFLQGAQGHVRE